jgi:hypothetical protein
MGDISRHRDIFLNLREAIPASLLEKCKLTVADLTYLEMGNYLTDVSQFRDPVMYIFAKQRIWREFILPEAAKKAEVFRGLGILAGAASLAAGQVLKELTSGVTSQIAKYAGPALAGLGGALAVLPTDTYAMIGGAVSWIDKMFGTPIEEIPGDLKKGERDDKHYGYVGQFFRYFIEGITHLLFADDIRDKVKGEWGRLDRIPEKSVTAVFEEYFTQYYPHEHTDQPPYVWDASERPRHPMYKPSKRQRTLADNEDIGVMNAVDHHYVQYLSEGLSDLEQEWRKIKDVDIQARHKCLVRMGKLLHGVEDWYFHSNVVELIRARGHRPVQGVGYNTEDFLKRFVQETSEKDQEFKNDVKPEERVRLMRRLYRRLRFPEYDRGDRTNSGGKINKKISTLSLNHAYPAFPSQQDTAHTILHALENLERKISHPSSPTLTRELPPWAPCVVGKLIDARGGDGQKLLEEKAKARGVTKRQAIAALVLGGTERDKATAVIKDVLREWLPLVVTLLDESERQRLVAGVEPLEWPDKDSATASLRSESRSKVETDKQLERHRVALKPKLNEEGFNENNYERATRYLVECGFLNVSGQKALVTAFGIDQKSQQLLEGAPGSGGFLIKFAVELQTVLDEGDAATEKLNKDKEENRSIFSLASDNGAFNEIVGSHSLMSKDTLTSPPFFDDAKVLASLASSSVFHIMLEQISAPMSDRRLPWKVILHHLIRFPLVEGGWERHAIAFFKDPENTDKKIPRYTDLPELTQLVESALRSPAALNPWRKGTKNDELKKMYVLLETKLSEYRYP